MHTSAIRIRPMTSDADATLALKYVGQKLEALGGCSVARHESGLSFKSSPAVMFASWHLLLAISSGSVELSDDGEGWALRVKLAFTRLKYFAAVQVAVFAMAGVIRDGRGFDFALVGICVSATLTAATYATGAYRFDRLLRQSIREAGFAAQS